MSPNILNTSLVTDVMSSNVVDVSLKSDSYYDSTGVYSTILIVYIVIIVVLVVLAIGGCIIVCICGGPKVTPGRVHYPPSTNQVQGVIPGAPTLTSLAVPQGAIATGYQNANVQHAPNVGEKGSPPPCYDDAVNTAFVNPMYQS